MSLFGINNVEDLKIRIITGLCNNTKKIGRVLKLIMENISFSFGIGNAASISINLSNISDVLEERRIKRLLNNNKKQYVVILDDIERKDYKLSIAEVLGTADELLKNSNIKVILVTNFDKIKLNKECDEFKEFKEKIAKHTFELNNVVNVVDSIVHEKSKYLTGKNLRTISQYKEILDYISSCSINYPEIIKQIIYVVLRIEKEKVDIFNHAFVLKKRSYFPSGVPSDEEIQKEVLSLPIRNIVSQYVIDSISLMDNEKRYTKESVEKAIAYIYDSLYEGDYNKLLSIPKLEYGIFIDVSPNVILANDENSIIKCIENFKNAFGINNINYQETATKYCEFIYNYYSTNSSNERIKESFDASIKKYVTTIVEKALKEPHICVEVISGIEEAIRAHPSNKYASRLNGDILRRIYNILAQGPYNDGACFVEKVDLLYAFFKLRNSFPDELFAGFAKVNKHFVDGLAYIYEKCELSIDSIEWNAFKAFFRVLNMTQVNMSYKEAARKYLKQAGNAAERYQELIALIR